LNSNFKFNSKTSCEIGGAHMKKYSQITEWQRYMINTMLKTGYHQTDIVKEYDIHKSTMNQELKPSCNYLVFNHKYDYPYTGNRNDSKV
jgi:IS30 family transposase